MISLFSGERFAKFIGKKSLCAVVVDAEEDFDWVSPIPGVAHDIRNMQYIDDFQKVCAVYGANPSYLLTYPVLLSSEVLQNLKRHLNSEACSVGIQLHSWVNPPYEQADINSDVSTLSYAGNLSSLLEEQKFLALIRQFESGFGFAPTMYRAGRYGLSQTSAKLLEKYGFKVDTSVAPRTDFTAAGGPDYRTFNSVPFWFGETAPVFELPLCRDLVGWLGKLSPKLYEFGNTPIGKRLHVHALAASCRAAERITLSPEGNDLSALKRFARSLRRESRSIYVISFHSSSLGIGKNPYVSTVDEWRNFRDRLSGILHYMKFNLDVEFVSLNNVPQYYDVGSLK